MTTSDLWRSGTAELAAVLARTEMFGRLPEASRAELADRCHVRRYSTGERVFTRGDAGRAMYVIAHGAVALTVSAADGAEVVLAVLRPVSAFGELSLIDHGARIATATARQDSVLLMVPGSAVRRLLHADPEFALAVLTGLARLVRTLDDYLVDRTVLDLRARVVKYLLSAAEQGTAAAPDSPGAPSEVRVDLTLNQSDLARLVGGSRQKVNRVIVDLERRGAIRRNGTHLVAIRPQALDRAGAE